MAERKKGGGGDRFTASTATKAASAIGSSATAITSGPFAYSVVITGDTTQFFNSVSELAQQFPQIMQALGQNSPIPISGDVTPLVADLQQAQQAAQQAGKQAGQAYAQGFNQEAQAANAQPASGGLGRTPLESANALVREQSKQQQAIQASAIQQGADLQRGLTVQISRARTQTEQLASDWSRVNAAVQQVNSIPIRFRGTEQAQQIVGQINQSLSRVADLSRQGLAPADLERRLLGAQGFASGFPAGQTGVPFSNTELRQGVQTELEASRQILATRLQEIEAQQRLVAGTELMATVQTKVVQDQTASLVVSSQQEEMAARQLQQEAQFDARHETAVQQVAADRQQSVVQAQQALVTQQQTTALATEEAKQIAAAKQARIESIATQRAAGIPTERAALGGLTVADLQRIDQLTANIRANMGAAGQSAQVLLNPLENRQVSRQAEFGYGPPAPGVPQIADTYESSGDLRGFPGARGSNQFAAPLAGRPSSLGPAEIRAYNTETQAMVDNVRRAESSWMSFNDNLSRVQAGVGRVTTSLRTSALGALQSGRNWADGTTAANNAAAAAARAADDATNGTARQISGLQRFNQQLGYSINLIARYTLIYGAINLVTGAVQSLYETTQRATTAQFELGRALSAATQPQVAERVTQASNAIAGTSGRGRVSELEATADIAKLRNEYHLTEQQIIQLVQVSTDLAAVNQKELVPTANAVSLAIRGQSRTLESYGITLSENAIKQFAKLTDEQRKFYTDLPADEQAQIRFNELIRQAAIYHGAAAEFADKQASAYLRLGGALENLASTAGQGSGPFATLVGYLATAATSADKIIQADAILRQRSQEQRDLEEAANVPAQYRSRPDAGNQTVGMGTDANGQAAIYTPGQYGPGAGPLGQQTGGGSDIVRGILTQLGIAIPDQGPQEAPGRRSGPGFLETWLGVDAGGAEAAAADTKRELDDAINEWVRKRYIERYQRDFLGTQSEYEGGARGEQQDLPEPNRLRKDQEQEIERNARQAIDEQRRQVEDHARIQKQGYANEGKDAQAHFDQLKRGYDADLLESKRVSDAKRDTALDAIKLEENASQRARTLADRDSQDRKQREDDALQTTHEHQLQALQTQHTANDRLYAAEATNIRRNGQEAERAIAERVAGINRVYDTEQRRMADAERAETAHLQGQLDALDKQEQKRSDIAQDEQERQAIADAQQRLADLQSKPERPSPNTTRGDNRAPVNFGGVGAHLPTPDVGYKQENFQFGLDQQREQVVAAQRSVTEAQAQIQETAHQREVRSQREALQQQLSSLRERYADERDLRANSHQQEVANLQAQTDAVRTSTQSQLDSIQAAKDAENDRYSSARETLTRLFAGEEALVARRRELESRDLQDRRAAEDEWYRERNEAVRQTYDYETRTASDQHDYLVALARNVLDNRKAMLDYYVQVVDEDARKVQEILQRYNESGNVQSTEVGASITAGLAWGAIAAGKFGELDKAARSLVKGTVGAMNDEAEAHSPSRKTYRLGLDLGAGLVMGMAQSADATSTASADLAQKAILAAQDAKAALDAQNSAMGLASQTAADSTTAAGNTAVQQNDRIVDAVDRVNGTLTGDWKTAWDEAAGAVDIASAAINTSVDQVSTAIDKLHQKASDVAAAYKAGVGAVNPQLASGATGGTTEQGAQGGGLAIGGAAQGTGAAGGGGGGLSLYMGAGASIQHGEQGRLAYYRLGPNGPEPVYYDKGQEPEVVAQRRAGEQARERAWEDQARANFAASRNQPTEAANRAAAGLGAPDFSQVPMHNATTMPKQNAPGSTSTTVDSSRTINVNTPLIGTVNVRNDQDRELMVATIRHMFGVLEDGYADMVAAG